MENGWKIGEVAKRTGMTVRALRHYEQAGLIAPSLRTEGGHRLYAQEDLLRLQQIRSLRSMGFSVEQIKAFFDQPTSSAIQIIEMQLAKIKEEAEVLRNLSNKLSSVAAALTQSKRVSAEELFEVLREMTKMESYYTPEQLAELKERADKLGPEGMRAAEQEWARLYADVKAEIAKGTDPKSPRAQELAQKWRSLIHQFTGGNPAIEQNLKKVWQQETNVHGYDATEMRSAAEFCRQALE